MSAWTSEEGLTLIQPVNPNSQHMKAHSVQYRTATHPDNTHWTQLRWERYRHQRGRCAVCGLKLGLRWHLHHRHYRTLGHETLFDVAAVHPVCHKWADFWRRLSDKFWRWWWGFMQDH